MDLNSYSVSATHIRKTNAYIFDVASLFWMYGAPRVVLDFGIKRIFLKGG
jgi:hypothetical protein